MYLSDSHGVWVFAAFVQTLHIRVIAHDCVDFLCMCPRLEPTLSLKCLFIYIFYLIHIFGCEKGYPLHFLLHVQAIGLRSGSIVTNEVYLRCDCLHRAKEAQFVLEKG